ncbi:MAG: hypothetical protein WBB69_11310 [Anaerolineales bacterium]
MQAFLITSFDDESAVLTLILQKAGFTVRSARTILQLTSSWPEKPLDFILIAISGSTGQFLKALNQLRNHTVVPIMLITDPIDETSQVA